MARTLSGREDALTGILVYKSFKPQNPGIIRKVVRDEIVQHKIYERIKIRVIEVEVDWLKETKRQQKTTVEKVAGLCDFEALLEEHKRKYEKQAEMAKRLKEM